jgi:hypothetical protein
MAAIAHDQGSEGSPDRFGIGREQGLTDDAADIVFA